MSFVSKLALTSVVIAGLAYWWSATFNIPDGLEQKNEVVWIYAITRAAKFMTELGENIGLGHRTNLMRKLAELQFLESRKPTYDDISIYKDVFAGVEVLKITPKDIEVSVPALVWIHGGGWVFGSEDSDIEFLEELSRTMNIVIVSVKYRLAPENPFPAPLDDCVKVTLHLFEKAIEHKVDPFKVAVGGMSAGGNLAAAVSMKIRDSGIPWKIKLQLLIVPCLQAYRFDTPSYEQNAQDEYLSRSDMANFWLWYAFGPEGHLLLDDFLSGRHLQVIDPIGNLSDFVDWKSLGVNSTDGNTISPLFSLSEDSNNKIVKLKDVLTDPYYAPLMSQNLSGLPSTYIVTAEFDVLRDDGLMYGERLKRQHVETKVAHYYGAFHYVLLWNDHYNLSKRVFEDVVNYLKDRL